jgi:glutaredoxin
MATKPKITIWMQNTTVDGIMAAKLAAAYGYEYEIKNVSNNYDWPDLEAAVPGSHRKLPQIFVGTKLVGGVSGLVTELGIDPNNLI